MSEFPTLNQMGISKPEDIDRYSLQTVNNIDILRVVYKHKKGSFLPVSKRFRFERTEELVLAKDGDPRDAQVLTETSPFLRKALVELDTVVRTRRDAAKRVALISEELARLNDEMNSRVAYIQSLVDELKS